MPKKITKEENDEINSALAELENEDEAVCDYTERQEELDWMTARLCEMSKKDFDMFIKAVRLQRRAIACRGRMYAGA